MSTTERDAIIAEMLILKGLDLYQEQRAWNQAVDRCVHIVSSHLTEHAQPAERPTDVERDNMYIPWVRQRICEYLDSRNPFPSIADGFLFADELAAYIVRMDSAAQSQKEPHGSAE